MGCDVQFCIFILATQQVGWNDRKRTFYRQLANVTTTLSPNESDWLSSSESTPEAVYYEEECTFTCE